MERAGRHAYHVALPDHLFTPELHLAIAGFRAVVSSQVDRILLLTVYPGYDFPGAVVVDGRDRPGLKQAANTINVWSSSSCST